MGLSFYGKYGRAASKIRSAMESGHLSHAYIIEGSHNIDKEGFAKAFCQALICRQAPGEGCGRCIDCRKITDGNFEDLRIVSPGAATDRKAAEKAFEDLAEKLAGNDPGSSEAVRKPNTESIKDQQIEELQEELKTKPTACEHNMAIIEGADTMTARAQTRFLKTLEEPSEGTVIIMLSENPEELLPTIRSRCVIERLYENRVSDDGEMGALARKLVEMAKEKDYFFDIKGELDRAVKSRIDAYSLLDAMENYFGKLSRDVNVAGGNPGKISTDAIRRSVSEIEGSRKDIKLGAGYNYRLRSLMLELEDIIQ